ncbi:MAG: RluA family pseudouridine synthase [Elusimicrobiota bacterium]|jgi:23S rRNA pseudouridine1911/1915/1917 synthase|nr:RluA family pseudouridine synthase [Elusimicrobiota bacterium]
MQKIIYPNFERQRVDVFLANTFKQYSRTYFQKLTESADNFVLVNGKNVLSSHKLKHGDIIELEFSEEKTAENISPQNIDLDIVYEDEDIIVINKRAGIVVHPSYGHPDGTMLNALAAHSKGKWRPFLLHRLDKDTTGLIVFAKNDKAKTSISKQFQNRAVKKIYYTAAKGIIAENFGRIEAPLGRSPENRKIMSVNPTAKKMAVSEFKVLARKSGFTLLEVSIITGRTHQIRSHLKYINHPVVGDKEYGGPVVVEGKKYERQMLHCAFLGFTHPKTSKPLKFNAPCPEDMREIFGKLKPKEEK